jgi:formimidoylglutamate deiminase
MAFATELQLPGIPNIHSHAFQRAMAGLGERHSHPTDSFWTWREQMYRFAGRITPEAQYDIAAQLYVEMLEAGYTSVCEFHYLHHQPDGRPYADKAAMSRAIIQAARDTGIRLTLLPVLYMTGGFDGRPLSERQSRFGHTVDAYLDLFRTLRREEDAQLRVGIALHSLRAVPEMAIREVMDAVGGKQLPIHIHIAEQLAEVEECKAMRGARPVDWLLANAPVDDRWTLVHATHLTPAEANGIAESGAVVALCPSTEANLGDGLFPLREFFDLDGRIGIGSDSNVSMSAVEELRWLEYGQRLITRERAIGVTVAEPSVGRCLFELAVAGGLQACAQAEQGDDRIVLDAEAPALVGVTPEDLHDRFVFAGNRSLIKEVRIGGKTVVAEGQHPRREAIAARYRRTLENLLASA